MNNEEDAAQAERFLQRVRKINRGMGYFSDYHHDQHLPQQQQQQGMSSFDMFSNHNTVSPADTLASAFDLFKHEI